MRSLLCCLPVLIGLSACTNSPSHENFTFVSTTQENEAFMPMLAAETAVKGYEMTQLYKPVIYNGPVQKPYSPNIRRSTLENLAQNSW